MTNPFKDDPFVREGEKSLTDKQVTASMTRINRQLRGHTSAKLFSLKQCLGIAATIVLLMSVGGGYYATADPLMRAINKENYVMGTAPFSTMMAASDAPTDLQPLRDQAAQFYKFGKYQQALDVFKNLQVRQPNNVFYVMYIGDTYLKMGKLDLAETYLREAMMKFKDLGKVDPEYCSRFYLGLALILQAKPEEARPLLEKIREMKGSISERAERILEEL